MPEISVIVPTFNRSEALRETLPFFVHQTIDPHRYEVIIVDDGSSDDTDRVVATYAAEHPSFRLRYERHSTNRLRAAACNTGARLARGQFVVFTDDDLRPVPHWLEAHLERHRSENRDVAVTGLVLYPETWERNSNWVRFGNDNYRRSLLIHSRDSGILPPNRFAGGNSSLRRETLLRVGPFDEAIRRAEDVALGCALVSAGIPLLCEPKALTYHYAEAILSIDGTLRSFRRSYEHDMSALREKYPWYFAKYGHWFLESHKTTYDTPRRGLAKALVRLVARRKPQRAVVRLLKWVDRSPWLYWRPLYQYVLACEAVDAIRASQKRQNATQ